MSQYEYNNPNPLSPAKGVIIGILLGVVIWILLCSAVWAIVLIFH